MAFDALQRHVESLGGLRNLDGGAFRPFTSAELDDLANKIGAPLPAALAWWLSTYGGGL